MGSFFPYDSGWIAKGWEKTSLGRASIVGRLILCEFAAMNRP